METLLYTCIANILVCSCDWLKENNIVELHAQHAQPQTQLEVKDDHTGYPAWPAHSKYFAFHLFFALRLARHVQDINS